MNGTYDDPFEMYDLYHHPDVAAEYGRYMAAFARMENCVYFLFSRMLGERKPHIRNAQAILGHIQSFGLKLTIIESYLPYSGLQERERQDAEAAIGIARECNKFRNSLAHGMFLLSGEELHLHPYAFEYKKTKPEPIDAETIRDRREYDVERAYIMFRDLGFGRALPPNFPDRAPTLVPPKKTASRKR
jgi:hypothetical protein